MKYHANTKRVYVKIDGKGSGLTPGGTLLNQDRQDND